MLPVRHVITQPPLVTFREAILRLGLTTGLRVVLDAGDAQSYSSGQSWLDRSGNGYDFFVGAMGGAEASDPTFNNNVGSLFPSAYWSVDGGDFFRYDTTNEAWMSSLHKDSALFAFACWYYYTTTSARFFGDANSTSNPGVIFQTNGSRPQLFVRNGTGTALNQTSSNSPGMTLVSNAWNFVGVRLDEAAGTRGSTFFCNGTSVAFTGTYTSPSASDAAETMELLTQGSGGTPSPTGQGIAGLWWWEGATPTDLEIHRIYKFTRNRFRS